jgi:hypothetical protein
MVRAFALACLLLVVQLAASNQALKERVLSKVETILDAKSFEENRAFIDIIFSPAQKFMENDRVDSVKVIETLKANGLLELFFNKPTPIVLEFKTNGSPIFFVKIVSDTLRNIGYYRFVTKASTYSNSEFSWSVNIVSEYMADPMILQNELQKKGCKIIDIERESATKWSYSVDMRHAKLDVDQLQEGYVKKLRHSLFAYWLDVSKIRRLRIVSHGRNHWYPDISFYDSLLHLVKVIRRDKKSYDITVAIPKDATYIKIADIYTMKNIKDSIELHPVGSR